MMTTSSQKSPLERNEHPFAQFVRILGKGKKGSRSLTRSEANLAMGMILDGDVLDLQLGAFLMLLRVKEESPEELAGFVEAAQERMQSPNLTFDIDWSSYAGKKRHPPWFLLSAILLAENGLKIFMHGAEGHTIGRLYTREVVQEFGLQVIKHWSQINTTQSNFVYMPLKVISPQLDNIIQMRSLLGLRSPVHSMARLLNPLLSPLVVQGIFHPPYSPIHQASADLLGYSKTLVIKGEGGEFECNPDNDCTVRYLREGKQLEEVWPRRFTKRHVKPDGLLVSHMKSVWRGERHDAYAEGAIISTAALVIKHHNDITQQQAIDLVTLWWERRNDHLI